MSKNVKVNLLDRYVERLAAGVNAVEAGGKNGRSQNVEQALKDAVTLINKVKSSGKKIIFIGNGGSASVASHQAVDFWKNGNIKAVSFNDPSLLTCVANDYGYEYVFQKPVEKFAEKGDLLLAISSSGKSPNILNGVKSAKKKGCAVITLSGFDKKNTLRKLGDINFFVPSYSYGIVEISHLLICHSILDSIMEQ